MSAIPKPSPSMEAPAMRASTAPATATAATGDTDRSDQRRRVPFTVIDEAVQLLDTAAEPWGIQLELGFEGRVDVDRLRTAVHDALSRHPMACARRTPGRRTDRNWWWEIPAAPDVDPLAPSVWADDDALDAARAEFHSVPVPLAESPPFRLRLARGPRHDVLMLKANHAAFDGIGCVRLLESVARAYTGREDPPAPVGLEEARDIDRLLAAGNRRARAERARALIHKASDIVRPPTPPSTDGGRDLPGYGFCHLTADEALTAALTAPGHDATVNDLLVAALHLTIAEWNGEHGARSRRIGVLIPVNLRPKEWRHDVVTNLVLDARSATSPSDRASPSATLRAVVAEAERAKAGGGAALVEVLSGLTRLPVWAKELLAPLPWLTGNRLVDSAIVSNLGALPDVPSFGDEAGATSEVWFSAPCRMPCAISVGAVTVSGQLHLAFRYRHPAFDRAGGRRFAAMFVSQLGRVAGECAPQEGG